MAVQLEFNLTRESTVLAFPMARRFDLVQATAETLMSRSNASGARYWRKHVRALWDDYEAKGFVDHAIEPMLVEYAQAVSRAMLVLRYRDAG